MRLNIQLFAEEDGKIIIKAVLDTDELEDEVDDLPGKLDIDSVLKKIGTKLKSLFGSVSSQFSKIGVKIGEVAKKTLSFMGSTLKTILELGVGLTGALGVVALLGGAFLIIGKALEKVFDENENLIYQVKYIIYALSQSLQPIINWVANALAKIIQTVINGIYYIMALINMIAGKNVFPSAKQFAEDMKNAEDSSAGVAKNAKDAKKQLAGFDEMNVIQDNKTGGGGASGASIDINPGAIDDAFGAIQKKVEDFVAKVKTAYTTLREANTAENRRMILESDTTWGLMKLGIFDTIQGIILMVQGLADVVGGTMKIIKGIITGDTALIKEGITQVITGIKEEVLGIQQFITGISETIFGVIVGVLKTIWLKISEYINIATTAVSKAIDKISGFFGNLKIKIENKIGEIKTMLTEKFGGIGTAVGNLVGDRFKSVINGVLTLAQTMLNKPINSINSLIGKVNTITGSKITKLSTFNFPKLAKGGIINQPGRGVAIGGERGAEGVIPLTDSQQMQLLGEAIGRYITINASITNTMNGRIISRELQKINNENSFAGNR